MSSGEFAEADARLAAMHGYRAIGETEQAVLAERLGLARLVCRLAAALEVIQNNGVPATRESIDVAASTLYLCLPLIQLARERVKLEDELADVRG